MAHLLLHVAQNNQHKVMKPRMFRYRTQPLDCLDDDELMILDTSSTALLCYRQFPASRRCGDLHGVSQSSVSRCVYAVANALNRYAYQFIRFLTDEASQRHIKAEFYDIAAELSSERI